MRCTLLIDDSRTMRLWGWKLQEVTGLLRTTHDVVQEAPLSENPAPVEGAVPVIITDGMDPSWTDGRMARHLRDAGLVDPIMAVLLPPILWDRIPSCRMYYEGRYVGDDLAPMLIFEDEEMPPSFALVVTSPGGFDDALAFRANKAAYWRRCLFLPYDVSPAAPTVPTPNDEKVRRFINMNGPRVRRLAATLARVPVLTGEIVHDVACHVVDGATFEEEAECLLGGIVKRTEPEADTFVMLDEAKDALRGLVRNDDLARLRAYLGEPSAG